MKVLNEVKKRFSETKEFIKDCMEQECRKENLSVDEVIFFFNMPTSKKLAQRNIFYFVVLGFKAETFSLSHDIYFRVV